MGLARGCKSPPCVTPPHQLLHRSGGGGGGGPSEMPSLPQPTAAVAVTAASNVRAHEVVGATSKENPGYDGNKANCGEWWSYLLRSPYRNMK